MLGGGLTRFSRPQVVLCRNMPSTNSFSRNITAALAVLRSAISTVSRTEMVRPGGVQHQSGQHRAAFRQAASAKVLVRLSKHGEA